MKKQSNYVTYGKLIDELMKFDPNSQAFIISTTNPNCPDRGDNFIDGDGISKVRVIYNEFCHPDVYVKIVCSSHGKMKYGDVIRSLRQQITLAMVDMQAIVMIGYRDMYDVDGYPCVPRPVINCDVLKEDDIWNITLGPKV